MNELRKISIEILSELDDLELTVNAKNSEWFHRMARMGMKAGEAAVMAGSMNVQPPDPETMKSMFSMLLPGLNEVERDLQILGNIRMMAEHLERATRPFGQS